MLSLEVEEKPTLKLSSRRPRAALVGISLLGMAALLVIAALATALVLEKQQKMIASNPPSPVATVSDLAVLLNTPPSQQQTLAAQYLGTGCNILNGIGCNPAQLLPVGGTVGTYFPGPLIASPAGMSVSSAASAVQVIATNAWSQNTDVSVTTSMVDFANSLCSSFGISVGLPVYGAEFSGSTAFNQQQSTMYGSSSTQYTADASVTYITNGAQFDNRVTLQAAGTSLQAAMAALPTSIGSAQGMTPALSKYWQFFQQFSTHFVSNVQFGGALHQLYTASASDYESSHMTANEVKASLGLSFMGLGIGTTSSSSTSTTTASASSLFSQTGSNIYVGGDSQLLAGGLTATSVQNWATSVPATPQVITTQLTPISTLFPAAMQSVVEEALSRLLTICPTSSSGLSCGGVGSCNFDLGTCSCPADRPGVACVIECTANCTNGGYCDYATGLCVCPQPQGQIGYSGCNCENACGMQIYNSPIPPNGVADAYDDCAAADQHCGVESGTAACLSYLADTFPGAALICPTSPTYGSSQNGQTTLQAFSGDICQAGFWDRCSPILELTCLVSNVPSCSQPSAATCST